MMSSTATSHPCGPFTTAMNSSLFWRFIQTCGARQAGKNTRYPRDAHAWLPPMSDAYLWPLHHSHEFFALLEIHPDVRSAPGGKEYEVPSRCPCLAATHVRRI